MNDKEKIVISASNSNTNATFAEDMGYALKACDYKDPPYVALSVTDDDTYVFQDRAGKPGGGKGPLVSVGFYPTMTGHPFMTCLKEDLPLLYDNHPSDSRIKESSDVCPTLRERLGTGGGNVPLVREPMVYGQNASDARVTEIKDDICTTLNTRVVSGAPNTPLVREKLGEGNFPVLHNGQIWDNVENDMSPCLRARGGTGGNSVPMFMDEDMEKTRYVVRRITPRECERLQGFPNAGDIGPDGKVLERDYTDIPWKDGGHVPDSHRYKALGNSMAVPVMRWIGERIEYALANPITEDKSDKIAYQTSLFDF